jgi:hypothetical protein
MFEADAKFVPLIVSMPDPLVKEGETAETTGAK